MLNILIVDDSMIFRTMLTELLTEHGYNVIGEAVNGVEAIRMHSELQPDVTFMDITMPEMNGLRALRRILENDPDAKIIMVSSTARQENISEALIIGAYDFLRKPLDTEKLFGLLADFTEEV